MSITTLLIDLGGVLVRLNWKNTLSELIGKDVPLEKLHNTWLTSQAVLDFECGRTDFDQFSEAFRKEFSTPWSAEEIQQKFMGILDGPKTNAESALKELRSHFRLALLSNTNKPHFDLISSEYGLFEHFDDLFLSFRLGIMKPDLSIYQTALEKLEVAPEEVAFFDDGLINVEAAATLGINSYQVFSPEEIISIVL